MRKIIFLLFAIIPFVAFSQKAKIEFEETTHNFGTISETGGIATYEFAFKNTGNAPLILTNVRTSCGCTTPTWSREPIAPGQKGAIKVGFDPRNRPNNFMKSITVNSNAENPIVSLTIQGTVTKKPVDPYAIYTYSMGNLKAISNNLNLGSINNTQVIEKSMEIVNIGADPVNVTASSPSKHITVSVTPSTLAKGEKGKIQITYDAAQKKDWGFVSDKINITTNQNGNGSIAVVANINEDFSQYKDGDANAPIAVFSETEADLGNVGKNASRTHEFYITNTGKSDLVIRKIKTSDNNITVNPAKDIIKPGKKIKVTVHIKADDRAGKKTKIAAFTLNDPKNITVTYKISGNVL